jgi:uridine monophosphate synthetase
MQTSQSYTDSLATIGSVMFGDFTLKSGVSSPYYLDLRKIVSHPNVFEQTVKSLLSKSSHINYDLICGVPYTALTFASGMALFAKKPLIVRRKETKNYGTQNKIDGEFRDKQRCLVVEDVITSGASVLETIKDLESKQLIVEDVLVLVDRMQGGKQSLENKGYKVHTLLTIEEILESLKDSNFLKQTQFEQAQQFLIQHSYS